MLVNLCATIFHVNKMLNEINPVSIVFVRNAIELGFMKCFKERNTRAVNFIWSALTNRGQVEELLHKVRLPVICAYYV